MPLLEELLRAEHQPRKCQYPLAPTLRVRSMDNGSVERSDGSIGDRRGLILHLFPAPTLVAELCCRATVRGLLQ